MDYQPSTDIARLRSQTLGSLIYMSLGSIWMTIKDCDPHNVEDQRWQLPVYRQSFDTNIPSSRRHIVSFIRDFLVCMHNIHSTLNGWHEKLYNCQRMDHLLFLINHQVFIYIRVVCHSGYDVTTMKPTPVFALSQHYKPPASRASNSSRLRQEPAIIRCQLRRALNVTQLNSCLWNRKEYYKQELPIFFRQIQPQYCKRQDPGKGVENLVWSWPWKSQTVEASNNISAPEVWVSHVLADSQQIL